jgi:putative isomerase
MIGMDNDPATFGRPRFSTANVFLNFFLVKEFRAMAKVLDLLGAPSSDGARWRDKAARLEKAIQAECWDRRDRFFYSVDVDVKTRPYDWFHQGLGVFWNSLPIKIRAWSGFLALWTGTATADQAADLARHVADPLTFFSASGITSLAMDEKMFDVRATNNPSNWLGPIWIIVQYIVFRGLLDYGHRDLAEDLAQRTVTLLGGDLDRTGTLHEYYDPLTGLPVMNGGFVNWNILVLNMIDELRGTPSLKRFLQ